MNDEKFVPMGTKISPEAAEVWNAICEARQTDTYHMLQNFIYTMIRAAADPHALNPDIQKIMTMLEVDAGWQHAFNLAAPNTKTKVAQVVLILEQEGRKGFGAVMIDKPFMGAATMTECTDDILERVCEATMRGIYRRLRLLGARMECHNLSDVLLTMIDSQTVMEMAGELSDELPQAGDRAENNRPYAYGKKTKSTHRRTPDGEARRQQRIQFDEEDATTTDTPDRRPYGEKADEYLKNLEERAKAEESHDMEKEMGFRPFDQEW